MDSPQAQRRAIVVAFSLGSFVASVGLGALGWGSWSGFFAHPARALGIAFGFVMTLVALASPVNLSSGEREDPANRWMLDGDAIRYLGLALLLVGGVLRIWPMFVLGRRFSGLVAIQPGHELVTSGPYRHVRHPSYLGMLLALVGWSLLFRSGVGLIATGLGVSLLVARIESEEALLSSQFGSRYDAYRRRTWRLLPGIY